jgi:hypothetical protein
MTVYFAAGSGTGIGRTVVTAALAVVLRICREPSRSSSPPRGERGQANPATSTR